jgi:hypothetical protein
MRRVLTALCVASLLAACGDDDLASPQGNPDYSLTSSITTAIVPRGQVGTSTLTLLRTDGYAAIITLSAENVPAGVTVQFVPPTVDQSRTSSVVTISVSAAAATGTNVLTFKSTGTGTTAKTVTYSLTVPATP